MFELFCIFCWRVKCFFKFFFICGYVEQFWVFCVIVFVVFGRMIILQWDILRFCWSLCVRFCNKIFLIQLIFFDIESYFFKNIVFVEYYVVGFDDILIFFIIFIYFFLLWCVFEGKYFVRLYVKLGVIIDLLSCRVKENVGC